MARAALILAALLAAGSARAAAPALSVTATYEARMLLLKVADLRTDQVLYPDRYQLGARLTTIGALGVIKPSTLLVQANGSMAGGAPTPQIYFQTEKGRRKAVSFRGGPADPLSQLLGAALQPGGGSPCLGTVPVYDGRQRYDLTLSPAGGGGLSGAQRGFGLTRTVACRLGFRPISGFGRAPPKANPFLRGDPVATFAYAPRGDLWTLTDIAVPTMLGAGHISLTALRMDGRRPAFAPPPAHPKVVKRRR